MAVIVRINTLPAFVLSVLLAALPSAFSLVHADSVGFTVELIHRDNALNSPFFNPSETAYQRLANSLRRSSARANWFNLLLTSAGISDTILAYGGGGDYLMELSVGTPPVEIFATPETASDFLWTQCVNCLICFPQNFPLFDPNASSTYRQLPCDSSQCNSLIFTGCQSGSCVYISTLRNAVSIGILGMDTVSLASRSSKPFSLTNTAIGCGIENGLLAGRQGSGIVGLGRGPSSLVSRMGSDIGGKFSYCLVPSFSKLPSKMNFGNQGLVSGPGVMSAPLFSVEGLSLYFLKLEAISIEGKKLEFHSSFSSSYEGYMILDTGTKLTYLQDQLYLQLESELSRIVPLERTQGSIKEVTSLCYKTESDIDAPRITMHFTGADVELGASNILVRTAPDVVCFGFTNANNTEVGVYGNMAQTNFLIGYDLERETVSFKQTACAAN